MHVAVQKSGDPATDHSSAPSAGLGDVADTVIILTIVLISSLLGFWQERGAANAVVELLKMVSLHCSILRDGKARELPLDAVVPGDIVLLSAGDVIPADSLDAPWWRGRL